MRHEVSIARTTLLDLSTGTGNHLSLRRSRLFPIAMRRPFDLHPCRPTALAKDMVRRYSAQAFVGFLLGSCDVPVLRREGR